MEWFEQVVGEVQSVDGMALKGRDRLTATMRGILGADRIEAVEKINDLYTDPEALCEVAALAAVEPAVWDAWVAKAGSVRGSSKALQGLQRAVRRENETPRSLRVVGDEDGPYAPPGVPDGYRPPHGYRIDARGVWVDEKAAEGGWARLTVRPVYVVATTRNIDDDTVGYRIAWELEGHRGLVERDVPGRVAADARAIIALADYGCPVTSHNARELCKYLIAVAEENKGTIPLERTAARCGWMEGGFLLGRDWVGDEDRPVVLSVEAGEAQIADGIGRGGEWDGYCETLAMVAHLPMPWLAVWASVASVLLHPLGIHGGYTVDFSGETSGGKSTILEGGIAVWGHPDGALHGSWKMGGKGAVGFEYTAAFQHHLPPFNDDSKGIRKGKEDVAGEVLMMQGDGIGNRRGRPGGIREFPTWQSFLLSTGEQKITSFTKDGGATARTLCVVGKPFGDAEGAGRLAKVYRARMGKHYGHLGLRVLEWMMATEHMASVRGWHEANRQQWSEYLEAQGAVAGRLGEAVAVIHTAAHVCEAVGLPMPSCDPLQLAAQAAIGGGRDADQPSAALMHILDWAASQQSSFWGCHDTDGHGEPIRRGLWLGRWERGETWDALGVRPGALRDELARVNFDAGVIDRWTERGWVDIDRGGRPEVTCKVDGKSMRVVRIRRDAVEDALRRL